MIKLIKKKKREGVAKNRNEVILKSKGEILIILNADVIIPKDFIRKIFKCYELGADFVISDARAINASHKVIPRWVNVAQDYYYINKEIQWQEGFSCRKEAAIKVGMFPFIGRSAGASDAIFSKNLEKAGYKKVRDRKIIVRHYVDENYNTLFRIREFNRGRANVFKMFYRDKRSKEYILIDTILRTIINIILASTIVYPLYEAFGMSRYSPISQKILFLSFGLTLWRLFIKSQGSGKLLASS